MNIIIKVALQFVGKIIMNYIYVYFFLFLLQMTGLCLQKANNESLNLTWIICFRIHNTSFSTEKKDEQRIITFSCDECQKTFVSEVSLNIHKRNHELEKVLRVDSNDYMNNYTRVVKKRILKSQGKGCVNFAVAFIN